jgi:Zn-dependent M28 family amino/carboxypeptidase
VQEKGRRYPGANDNASGVGVLLEIAHLWHESGYRPQRSILFAAWGAQEQGQIGSRYYVEHPMFPMEKTVAMVQLDTVGGGDGYYLEAQSEGEPEGLLLFNLMATEDLVDGRLALSNKWGQSDQVPFYDAGVPALLLTWREASDDNWPVEIADEVDPYRLGVTGRMVSLAVMSLAR